MPHYIWQHPQWHQGIAPPFTWQKESLRHALENVRLEQGRLLGRAELLPEATQAPAQLDALVQTALRTSEIEGEILNVASVRSSVVRHLGLEHAGFVNSKANGTPQTECLVKLLIEATSQPDQALSLDTLCQWQAALFPESPQGPEAYALTQLKIGELRSQATMQVISGRLDKPTVHFEAPPRSGLEQQVQRFIHWFNHPPGDLDSILRAGIAHLWLITLHPFDDGNGRVTRAVTDRALAQVEHNSIRFYSLSAAIMARRKEYYQQLEQAQKLGYPDSNPDTNSDTNNIDITPWLSWFLSVLIDAIQQGQHRFQRVIDKTRFWQQHAQTVLSERQIKVLNRLLDGQGEEFNEGINARKYMSLAKVSKATATRELADLLAKQCIRKLPGGGRSTRYVIASNKQS
ncbi:MAG: Fic family protein [Ketobacter sp.]|nr:Fic family protein [Ketobacter sp.]